MRVLALARYGNLAAGSRIRLAQYLPGLQARGIQVDVDVLLDDSYVSAIYAGRPPDPVRVAAAYLRRLWRVLNGRRYDLLWIQYELFPWLPPWVEQMLQFLGIPYVVDLDDALFHRYDLHRSPWVRGLLGGKIDQVLRGATAVLAGNDYLGQRALRAGAAHVFHVPSVVDLRRYPAAPPPPPDQEFTIGWVGSPSTAPFLRLLTEALARLGSRLVVVGSGDQGLHGVNVEYLPWSEATEVDLIRQFHVGVMPLPDDPWSRGKCGYKLIQYMACSRPVVASPVGVNEKLVMPGHNGLLASTTDEWVEALQFLAAEPARAAVMGEAGRRRVEQDYSLQVVGPRFADILEHAAARFQGHSTSAANLESARIL